VPVVTADPEKIRFAIDVLALVSAAFLAVPAWHLNRHAALAARMRHSRVVFKDAALSERHRALSARLEALRDDWKHWKAMCLHIGTAAGLLATFLAVVLRFM
jgi:hypothetical protein